jgi:amidohydrolase
VACFKYDACQRQLCCLPNGDFGVSRRESEAIVLDSLKQHGLQLYSGSHTALGRLSTSVMCVIQSSVVTMELRTSEFVAGKLSEFGCEVHRNIGKTGVVGVLRTGNGPSVGLRADMDALPIHEANDIPYRSQYEGRMHACGHDGHTAMLLGAACYLAETRNFAGTVNFIFQPAEEGTGSAKAMLDDGLFERFPCDSVFGMHNRPDLPIGKFAIRPGAMMAGGAFFDITVANR